MDKDQKLRNLLEKIDRTAAPLDGGGAIIVSENGRYLSGSLYLWSHFAERAFVFKDVGQAQRVIDQCALAAHVRVWRT